MKKYWLNLFSDTFIWTKEEQGLVYNSGNGEHFHFLYTNQVKLLADKLNLLENLYRILIPEEFLSEDEVRSFIDHIVKIKGGIFSEDESVLDAQISLKPELRIRDDVTFYKWRHNNGIGGNILYNLNGLLFYINGSDYGSNVYYKQTIFPLQSSHLLPKEKIMNFASSCKKSSFLLNVSLIGDILGYPDYQQLIADLVELGFNVVLYCLDKDVLRYGKANYQNIAKNEKVILHILVSNYDEAFQLFELGEDLDIGRIEYDFLVKNELDYEQALEIIEKYRLNKREIVPVYTGDNLQFFKDFVYVSEDEIIHSNLSKREIFARQALNIPSFGKLCILPDGSVYANCNHAIIGHIDDLPYDIVYKEMLEGCSWLNIRNNKPCCDCIYQWLCPSPSNYELVIGQPNLCHIN